MAEIFRVLAERISFIVGSPWTFIAAILVVAAWSIAGPVFGFSDTWQLVINTGTTIITFLMVFLIQNTQNRDTMSIQLKLDELLRAVQGARTEMINLDTLSDADLLRLQEEFQRLGKENGVSPSASVETTVTSETTTETTSQTGAQAAPDTSVSSTTGKTKVEIKNKPDH